MLDIFNQDAFSVIRLTDAINKVPHIPGRAGQVIDWQEQGIDTTSVMIEEVSGQLRLLNPVPRGGAGETTEKSKRKVRSLIVPHYQHDDAIMADEVQGVRAFGQESQVETVFNKVNMRMQETVALRMDPTLEYQRIGAVKGIIVNGDGSTMYNLFNEFGVQQPAQVAFALGNASTDVRGKCTQIVRAVANALGGIPYRGIYAFCSDDFWDALIRHPKVEDTFKYQEGMRLREGVAWQTLDFGGITFENYRGAIGTTPFIENPTAQFFPVGVPGLWRTLYAPADYIDTVNTIGLPRYARQYRMPNDKGVMLEQQMNPLNYCTRPNVLIKGTTAAS